MSLIQFKRGSKTSLPSSALAGEPLLAQDTKEVYIGNGAGVELVQVVTTKVDGGMFGDTPGDSVLDPLNGRFSWYVETTDDHSTEVFAGGIEGNRMYIPESSARSFRIMAIAKNNADNVGKVWRIEGGIKADQNGNVSLIGFVYTTVVCQDGEYNVMYTTDDWQIIISADNTNKALKLQVKGDIGKTIRWNVDCSVSEVKW